MKVQNYPKMEVIVVNDLSCNDAGTHIQKHGNGYLGLLQLRKQWRINAMNSKIPKVRTD